MNRVIYACLLVVGLLGIAMPSTAQLASSTWPKFHKDCANTGQGLYGGSSSELSWTYTAPGAVYSSPVIGTDGSVYFTCDDGNVYALSGGGTLLWAKPCGCLGASSPAIGSDGTVYVGSGSAFLYAYNPDGSLKWKRGTPGRVTSSINIAPNGTIYFGCADGSVVARNADGNPKWTYSVGGSVTSTPAIGSDGTVYVGSQAGGVYAIRATGTLKWRYDPPEGGGFSASPVVDQDQTVYIGSSSGHLHAILSTGARRWKYTAGSYIASSAALTPGGAVVFGARDSKLYAVSTGTGQKLWTPYSAGSYVESSPAVASDGTICFGSVGGIVYSITSGGALRWQYGTGSSVYSSPAIGPGGEIIVGSTSGTIYCFGADETPPTAAMITDDGDYTCYTDRLHGSWIATDAESGIFSYEYCIGTAPGLADVAGWLGVGPATSHTRTGLVLGDTQTYYITARATNGAGIVGAEGSSDGIVIDAIAPTTPVVVDDGVYTSNATTLHATWSSSDPESGVAKYSYSIGTTPGGANTVNWTDVGLATSVTKTGLALVNGVTYYVNVKATNTAGGVSLVGSADGIMVDVTAPDVPAVTDDGQFFSTPNAIHARWTSGDAQSGVALYEYCVGTTVGGGEIRPWTSVGTSAEITATGLSLTNGQLYYFSVRATNGVGIKSGVGSSDGIRLDTTVPSAPSVTDEGGFTASTTNLNASWIASDPESGIKAYRYAVGTTPGGTDALGWTAAGTVTSLAITGLSLTHDQTYYISVTATNGANADSPFGASDGIRVDATPPTKPVVTDDGNSQSWLDKISASWTSADPESDLLKYEYSIGTAPGLTDVFRWTDVGLSTSVTKTGLNLQEARTYYVNVRCTNKVGLVSEVGSSDGILIDSTPPPAPTVTDDGAFAPSLTSLHAYWTSVNTPSGVAYYDYSIGTAAGQTDIRDWTSAGLVNEVVATDLSLQDGAVYFINVRAISQVGKEGYVGSSDGITVDSTLPTTPTVTDGGAFAASASELAGTWSSADAESGIVLYEYAVGTSLGATDVRDWTSAGDATSMTIGSLALLDGMTYFIGVRATNGAGAKSEVGNSDGITIDLTPPSQPTVTDDGAFTTVGTELHGTWSSIDAESGIARFECAVGTTPGGTDALGWTSTGTATDYAIPGLSLVSGLTYYISVRAINGAGSASPVGISDGILVDATPPTTPVVMDDGQFTTDTSVLRATWSSQDPETGIVGYQYSIGTTSGGTEFTPWTGVGMDTSITRSGLSLVSGTTYYINVRATNGVGLVSIGSSDGLTVDTTAPPAPTVTDDGAYTCDPTQLRANLTCNDPESGVSRYECAIGTTPLGTDIVDWQDCGSGPDITITGLSLVTGVTYYFSARATNGAGIGGAAATSDGIKVDNTPPVGLVVNVDGEYTGSPTSMHGSWSATDPESGIGGYRYCIGTTPGSNDVADWLDVGTETDHTREGLSLVNGQTYYITAIATNGAGGVGEPVSSQGVKTDLTPPSTPVVSDTGIYWGYKSSLWASWSAYDPESGIAEYEVSAGTAPGATDVANWRSAGSAVSFTITGLRLNDGTTYYFNVRAKNGARSWGEAGSSDGVLIDSTPPTTPLVIDDGDTTSVLDRLHATWHSEDPESGIVEYTYCIGTSPGATDLIGWTSVGTGEEVTVTGLDLDPVLRHYFSVRAKSGSGAWSATGASDGIGYTSGAAIWGRFRNDIRGMGRGLFNATRISDLAWSIPTAGPVESSPAMAGDGTTYIGSNDGYLYAVTQNGSVRWSTNLSSPVNGSPAIADDGRILVGTHDGKVTCVDKAGVVAWTYTTGGPVLGSPVIRDGVVYVGSTDSSLYALSYETGSKLWSHATGGAIYASPAIDSAGVVYVTAEDGCVYAISPSGVRNWKHQTGSSIMASPAIDPDGVIYVGSGDGGFYAINPNGTRKWRFETYTIVNSSAAIGLDGNLYFGTGYEGSNGRLYALRPDGTEMWRVDLPGAAIVSSPAIDPSGTLYFGACDKKVYAYAPDKTRLWAFETGDSVYSSPALGADGSVVFGSYDGKIYCLRDATSKDLTPPTTPVVTVPSTSIAAGDVFAASWSATDPETMVAEYTYAVGTTPGGSDVAGWTSAGIETSMSRDDLPLEGGKTYYVSIKARNPSQRWSEVGVSQGVAVISVVGFDRLGALKCANDASGVSLCGKTVTAVFGDCFFIEESDRACGIRCFEGSASFQVGDIVDVQGDLETISGERCITGATHTLAGSGDLIRPLAISQSLMGRGVDTLGLLVSICGCVTDAGDGWFVVDDGSKLASSRSGTGLEVRCDGTPTSVGKHVRAVGVLCREPSNGQVATVLRLIPGKLNQFD